MFSVQTTPPPAGTKVQILSSYNGQNYPFMIWDGDKIMPILRAVYDNNNVNTRKGYLADVKFIRQDLPFYGGVIDTCEGTWLGNSVPPDRKPVKSATAPSKVMRKTFASGSSSDKRLAIHTPNLAGLVAKNKKFKSNKAGYRIKFEGNPHVSLRSIGGEASLPHGSTIALSSVWYNDHGFAWEILS